MSYYAGYHGVACYLSIEDFEDFMKSYFKLHPDLTGKRGFRPGGICF